MDREKVISWVEGLAEDDWHLFHSDSEVQNIAIEVLALLKEQNELLRKLQKDKDKLCLEVSEWKHEYHDRPLKDAVEPYHVNTNHEQHWKCGNCNAVISLQDKFCRECGKPVLLEAIEFAREFMSDAVHETATQFRRQEGR